MFWLISLLSGAAVGVTLGLVGGGGSILSVPLMMHVMGVSSPHVAVRTAHRDALADHPSLYAGGT